MNEIPRNASEATTEVVCIVDRSGSMHSLTEDAIGGYNAFLAGQQGLPGRAKLSLVLFDHEMTIVSDRVDLHEGKPLSARTYAPRGTTALFDAVGSTIRRVTEAIGLGPAADHPEKVVVAIMTDGLENASREWTGGAVRELVAERQNAGWEFVFLAAGLDAVEEAGKLGIGRADAFGFAKSKAGIVSTFDTMRDQVILKRGLAPLPKQPSDS